MLMRIKNIFILIINRLFPKVGPTSEELADRIANKKEK